METTLDATALLLSPVMVYSKGMEGVTNSRGLVERSRNQARAPIKRSFIIAIAGLLAGCTYGAQPLHINAPDAYGHHTAQSGIEFGAQVLDAHASKEKLDEDVTKDFVPVVVSLLNSSGDAVQVRASDVILKANGGKTASPVPWRDVYSEYKQSVAGSSFALGAIGASDAAKANDSMQRDWASKSMPAEMTLAPHEKGGGIVFFRRNASDEALLAIVALVRDLRNGTAFELKLGL